MPIMEEALEQLEEKQQQLAQGAVRMTHNHYGRRSTLAPRKVMWQPQHYLLHNLIHIHPLVVVKGGKGIDSQLLDLSFQMTHDVMICLYIFDVILYRLSSFESLMGQLSRFRIYYRLLYIIYDLASTTYICWYFFHIYLPMCLFDVDVGLYHSCMGTAPEILATRTWHFPALGSLLKLPICLGDSRSSQTDMETLQAPDHVEAKIIKKC